MWPHTHTHTPYILIWADKLQPEEWAKTRNTSPGSNLNITNKWKWGLTHTHTHTHTQHSYYIFLSRWPTAGITYQAFLCTNLILRLREWTQNVNEDFTGDGAVHGCSQTLQKVNFKRSHLKQRKLNHRWMSLTEAFYCSEQCYVCATLGIRIFFKSRMLRPLEEMKLQQQEWCETTKGGWREWQWGAAVSCKRCICSPSLLLLFTSASDVIPSRKRPWVTRVSMTKRNQPDKSILAGRSALMNRKGAYARCTSNTAGHGGECVWGEGVQITPTGWVWLQMKDSDRTSLWTAAVSTVEHVAMCCVLGFFKSLRWS